jgi:hypothetical protein
MSYSGQESGRTPLVEAVLKNNMEVVRVLVAGKACLDAQTTKVQIPD